MTIFAFDCGENGTTVILLEHYLNAFIHVDENNWQQIKHYVHMPRIPFRSLYFPLCATDTLPEHATSVPISGHSSLSCERTVP